MHNLLHCIDETWVYSHIFLNDLHVLYMFCDIYQLILTHTLLLFQVSQEASVVELKHMVASLKAALCEYSKRIDVLEEQVFEFECAV